VSERSTRAGASRRSAPRLGELQAGTCGVCGQRPRRACGQRGVTGTASPGGREGAAGLGLSCPVRWAMLSSCSPAAPIHAGAVRLPRLPVPVVARHGSAARARCGRSRVATALGLGRRRSRQLQKARFPASTHPSDQKRSPAEAL